jgi:hypothetical protein
LALALTAEPSAATDHGSELQVLAEGLAASNPADSVLVDLDEADLGEVDLGLAGSDRAGLDEAGSDEAGLDMVVWGN